MSGELPPLPRPPPDVEPLLDDDELEALFVGMCHGDYKSILALDEHHHAHQFLGFAVTRLGQLYVQLEQRTRT